MCIRDSPIPPLDGSRVVGGFLPRDLYLRWVDLDRYGNFVFMGLLVVMLAAPQVFQSTIGRVLDWSSARRRGGWGRGARFTREGGGAGGLTWRGGEGAGRTPLQ